MRGAARGGRPVEMADMMRERSGAWGSSGSMSGGVTRGVVTGTIGGGGVTDGRGGGTKLRRDGPVEARVELGLHE